MKRASLTLRLGLMFVCAVVAVLVAAGLSFNELSRRHFKAIDHQTLMEKLESTRQIMEGQSGSTDAAEVELQLQALLGAHPELSAIISANDGTLLFAAPKTTSLPQIEEPHTNQDIWEWTRDGHMYRGMTAQIRSVHQVDPVTVWLILDITGHMHFFETLQWWFVIGLAISAVISAALGWVVARSGLKPVAQVTQVAAAMSARSLKDRIPLEDVPHELVQLVSSFNAMLARLDESFVRLSNFSADSAHELRTPISNLRPHTEVILTKKRAPEMVMSHHFKKASAEFLIITGSNGECSYWVEKEEGAERVESCGDWHPKECQSPTSHVYVMTEADGVNLYSQILTGDD